MTRDELLKAAEDAARAEANYLSSYFPRAWTDRYAAAIVRIAEQHADALKAQLAEAKRKRLEETKEWADRGVEIGLLRAQVARQQAVMRKEWLKSQPAKDDPKHDMISCSVSECEDCAVILCPHKEPLHTHHDGCPACDVRHFENLRQERDAARDEAVAILGRTIKERDDAAYAGSIALSEAQTLTKELDATRAMHRETVKRLTEQRDDAYKQRNRLQDDVDAARAEAEKLRETIAELEKIRRRLITLTRVRESEVFHSARIDELRRRRKHLLEVAGVKGAV